MLFTAVSFSWQPRLRKSPTCFHLIICHRSSPLVRGRTLDSGHEGKVYSVGVNNTPCVEGLIWYLHRLPARVNGIWIHEGRLILADQLVSIFRFFSPFSSYTLQIALTCLFAAHNRHLTVFWRNLLRLFSGMEALKLPEECTVKGASTFLSTFIVFSRDPNGTQFQHIVTRNVENLLRTLCYCICK